MRALCYQYKVRFWNGKLHMSGREGHTLLDIKRILWCEIEKRVKRKEKEREKDEKKTLFQDELAT